MGLFDGQVKKLGDKLATAFKKRSEDLLEAAKGKDPNASFIDKITSNLLLEVAAVIESAVAE